MLDAPAARPIGRYSRRSQHMQAWQAGFTLFQLDHKHEFQEWWLGDWVRLRLLCCSSSLLSLAFKLTGASARHEQRCFEHTATAGIMQRCLMSISKKISTTTLAFQTETLEILMILWLTMMIMNMRMFRVKSGAIAVQTRSFSAL
jgi:hypothetical protein